MQYAMCLIFDLIELQDDVLVSFMGIARDELDKTPNEISFEKLQVSIHLPHHLIFTGQITKNKTEYILVNYCHYTMILYPFQSNHKS